MKLGTLTFFCGKMGAGKSTKAHAIAQERNAVLISEDEWLGAVYPNEISSLSDYVKFSGQLRPQIKRLAQSILLTGTDVVMDFPANTISQRELLRKIFVEVGASHCLVFIDVADEVCLKHIEKRRIEQPERATTDTVAMFEQVTKHFVEPRPEEGFNIISVSVDQ